MTGWEWDETLFGGSARYYEEGRLSYPNQIAGAIVDVAPRPGRLLDVGCGPGTLCLRVADAFAEVVGVDADPGMVAEATRLAAERGIGNARLVHSRAEDLPADLGLFDVVTFASSFHWMQRELVAGIVAGMLTPGGVVIHVDTVHSPPRDLPHPAPPGPAVKELVQSYVGAGRRAGRSVIVNTASGEDDILRGAGFSGPQEVPVPDGRLLERNIDQAVAAVFSMSFSAPHLFGDRIGDFEHDLRELLSSRTPSGYFSVVAPDVNLRVWRR